MKALRIIQSIGYFALFFASVFNLVNQITEKHIFGLAITLPLFLIALVLCDPTDCSTPGLPVHYQLPESTQTHVH